jgi:hypothetical protein
MIEIENFNDPNWAPAIRAGLLRPGDHMDDTHVTAIRADGTIIENVKVKNIRVMEGDATFSIPLDPNVVNELLPRQQRRHI